MATGPPPFQIQIGVVLERDADHGLAVVDEAAAPRPSWWTMLRLLNTPLNLSQPGRLVAVDRQEGVELHVGRPRLLGVGHGNEVLETRLCADRPRIFGYSSGLSFLVLTTKTLRMPV
mgnify:CR=1 FL=1